MTLTPDVRMQLNRTAQYGLETVADVAFTLANLLMSGAIWFKQHSEIFEARADVDDEELIEAMREEDD